MNQDPNFDGHEQRGPDDDLTQASLIPIAMVITSIIIITVLVDNSEAPWQIKMVFVGTALSSFIILAGWLD